MTLSITKSRKLKELQPNIGSAYFPLCQYIQHGGNDDLEASALLQ